MRLIERFREVLNEARLISIGDAARIPYLNAQEARSRKADFLLAWDSSDVATANLNYDWQDYDWQVKEAELQCSKAMAERTYRTVIANNIAAVLYVIVAIPGALLAHLYSFVPARPSMPSVSMPAFPSMPSISMPRIPSITTLFNCCRSSQNVGSGPVETIAPDVVKTPTPDVVETTATDVVETPTPDVVETPTPDVVETTTQALTEEVSEGRSRSSSRVIVL